MKNNLKLRLSEKFLKNAVNDSKRDTTGMAESLKIWGLTTFFNVLALPNVG